MSTLLLRVLVNQQRIVADRCCRFSSQKSQAEEAIAEGLGLQRCAKILPQLRSILGSDGFISDKEAVRAQYSHDEGHFLPHLPNFVVKPSSSAEIASVLRLCNAEYIPVVPFGTGTGLEGACIPVHGGITIDTSRLDAVLEVNNEDFNAHVQAGVTRMKLNSHLRNTGLWFTVDPGADASIGGMIATGASGTTSVRYGTMRQNVINLEVVLADGQIVHTRGKGRRPWKSSAGYDLTPLFIGSEGTLGVIASAWIQLHPLPPHLSAAVCSFASLGEALQAVVDIRRAVIPLSRVEFLDEEQVRACNDYKPGEAQLAEKPTLFLEFNGSTRREVEDQVKAVRELCTPLTFDSAIGQEAISKLWAARHDAYYATLAMRKGARGFITDVCVPISQLRVVLEAARKEIDSAQLYGAIVGHVGEGNFHCIFPVFEEDHEEMARVWKVSDKIVKHALQAGGTCTGEHGVGMGKKRYLVEQYGEETLSVMRSLKSALDPNKIMNPGKIF